MNSNKIRALHVPLGTRCEAITQRFVTSEDEAFLTWRVWLAIKNKQVPPHLYEGTYLELNEDGSIRQCNTETEEDYEVMDRFIRS